MQVSDEEETYCGFVAIVGRPNVGKSTLLNAMIGEKISITADKPQTTRHKIVGIKTVENKQAVFIDTPGMHLFNKKALNREMNKTAKSALRDVDAVLFLVEALTWNEEDDLVLQCVQHLPAPVFLIVNKVDMVKSKDELLPYLSNVSTKMNFKEVVPCSVTTGEHVALIESMVFATLPAGPFYYGADQTTDKTLAFRLSEIIREKLTRELSAELPYALSVEIEKMEQTDSQFVVHAVIWVERDSQKGIVIGKGGERLKKIGQQARLDMNHMLNASVHLELWVKVRDNWTDDERALRTLGYLQRD